MIIKVLHNDTYASKSALKLEAYFQEDSGFPDKVCTVFLLQDDYDIVGHPLYKLNPLSTAENFGRFEFIKGYLKALGYDPLNEMEKLCTEVQQVYKNDGFVLQKVFNCPSQVVLNDSGKTHNKTPQEAL